MRICVISYAQPACQGKVVMKMKLARLASASVQYASLAAWSVSANSSQAVPLSRHRWASLAVKAFSSACG
jgi:hypothetical protein